MGYFKNWATSSAAPSRDLGYDSTWERWIGPGVTAYCDHPKCAEEIDRGLAYVCGGEAYGGSRGCGLFFCPKHLQLPPRLCSRCSRFKQPYNHQKTEHPDWVGYYTGTRTMTWDPAAVWETFWSLVPLREALRVVRKTYRQPIHVMANRPTPENVIEAAGSVPHEPRMALITLEVQGSSQPIPIYYTDYIAVFDYLFPDLTTRARNIRIVQVVRQ